MNALTQKQANTFLNMCVTLDLSNDLEEPTKVSVSIGQVEITRSVYGIVTISKNVGSQRVVETHENVDCLARVYFPES